MSECLNVTLQNDEGRLSVNEQKKYSLGENGQVWPALGQYFEKLIPHNSF